MLNVGWLLISCWNELFFTAIHPFARWCALGNHTTWVEAVALANIVKSSVAGWLLFLLLLLDESAIITHQKGINVKSTAGKAVGSFSVRPVALPQTRFNSEQKGTEKNVQAAAGVRQCGFQSFSLAQSIPASPETSRNLGLAGNL